MREIKFRGKRTGNGEWVYGFTLVMPSTDGLDWWEETMIATQSEHYDSTDFKTVTPETVGQYTGLKDKNGTEIYEGDIVKHHNDILSTVFYNTSHCAYLLRDINGNRNKCQFYKLGNYSSLWIEVIGNIYDNPELMRSEE